MIGNYGPGYNLSVDAEFMLRDRGISKSTIIQKVQTLRKGTKTAVFKESDKALFIRYVEDESPKPGYNTKKLCWVLEIYSYNTQVIESKPLFSL